MPYYPGSFYGAPVAHRVGVTQSDGADPTSLLDTLGTTMPNGVIQPLPTQSFIDVDVTLVTGSNGGAVTIVPAWFNPDLTVPGTNPPPPGSFEDTNTITVAASVGATTRRRFRVETRGFPVWMKVVSVAGTGASVGIDISLS